MMNACDHAYATSHAASAVARCGGYSRLFHRTADRLSAASIEALSSTMLEDDGFDGPAGAAKPPPAGYTYLAQFVDHDLSFDDRLFADPVGKPPVNAVTPALDLGGLYGGGPNGDPLMYDKGMLVLSKSGTDFDRGSNGRAIMKDWRNDSNLLLSQLHVAFARYHNRVMTEQGVGKFCDARRIVVSHYQWLVLHDLLPALVGSGVVDSILRSSPVAGGLSLFPSGPPTAVPLEFSAAAFRFGHSMVRSSYVLNDLPGSGLRLIFDRARPDDEGARDLRGFRRVEPEQVVDWSFFFKTARREPQIARPIDTLICRPLFELPKSIARDDTPLGRRLPFRNLYRNEADLGLATGQEVATAMRNAGVPGTSQETLLLGLDRPIEVPHRRASRIAGVTFDRAALEAAVNKAAPLWYYVLKEAEVLRGGASLGPVGGRIVAETIIGLLLSDPASILNIGWRPAAGAFGAVPSAGGQTKFGIAELLAYAIPADIEPVPRQRDRRQPLDRPGVAGDACPAGSYSQIR